MIRLASIFADNMVAQRDTPISVWGWASPGETVRVSLGGVSAAAVAEAGGKFMATLPALPSGGPHELVVAGHSRLAIRNVMIGEVWFCSGQSNMEMPVGDATNAAAEITAANYPMIRLFTIPRALPINKDGFNPDEPCQHWLRRPQALPINKGGFNPGWNECSPDSAGNFSAAAYYFGRELHRRLGVPVGLIDSSWGGTRIEAWISRASLASDPLCRKEVADYEAYLQSPKAREDIARYQEHGERAFVRQDPGNQGLGRGWAGLAFDDSAWPGMDLPSSWQKAGHNYSGIFWFRKEVNIPAAWAGKDFILRVGACDKHDTTYFNNEPVGATGWEIWDAWRTPRIYKVPGRLVRAGRNVIAVRVYSFRNQGGMIGPANAMRLEPAGDSPDASIPLAGAWRFQVEHNFGFINPAVSMQPPLGPHNPNSPYALYDSRVSPLLPYALRGVIWYQGETNADRAYHYRSLMPLLIKDWRKAWGVGDFHFLIVQLANYRQAKDAPGESAWAELREAQLMTLAVPNTGLAVAIDIGDAGNIHPKNKQEVGRRLALAALAQAYGRKIVFSGPLLKSWRVDGGRVRLQFDHCGGGLAAAGGGPLKGFAVAGPDRKFHWAGAAIESKDSLAVRSANVPAPVAVRYAWADNPVCNLVNKDGLPASPFRTDDWPGVTMAPALS
ncbi:MAG: sialate O-acetylesterase [Kiritimatiellae bacterium]|nr:sialate O-acetylesterase [Kiritimatiellia bacterium]